MEPTESRGANAPHRPNWYERHVLPYLIDVACGTRMVRRQRDRVVPFAQGEVLEIGIGTGLNLPHYDRARVRRIVGVDPALEMHHLAQRRAKRTGLEVALVPLSAERIPFEAASFDSVVVTFTLCSIPDPLAALREMRRVLRPQGRLHFCEHGLAPEESVRRWQRRLTPMWRHIAGGCHLDRDIPALLAEAGFGAHDLQTRYLKGPRPMTFVYWGTAGAE